MQYTDDDIEDEEEPTGLTAKAKVPQRLSYGFDVEMLICAFDSLPKNDSPVEATFEERVHWRSIEDNLYKSMLRTLPDEAACHHDDRAATLYRSEQPILKRLASRMVAMTPNEAEKYWRPLLDKGPNATRFATYLLSSTKIECLKQSCDVMQLAPLFRGMLEHLQSSAQWSNNRREPYGDLWRELLFLGRFMDCRNDEQFAPLMVALMPYYESAVRNGAPSDFVYSGLIHHLAGTATRPFLPQVFEWCAPWTTRAGSIYWRDGHLRDAFSGLLQAGWKHCFGSIKRNAQAYESFKAIALALAALQDPVALEVQASLGRPRSSN